jgi:hypothetical protein
MEINSKSFSHTNFLHFGQGFFHEKKQFFSLECLGDPSFANNRTHFLLGLLYFFLQCTEYVVKEAEGGGPKPFTRLIKYGIDQ